MLSEDASKASGHRSHARRGLLCPHVKPRYTQTRRTSLADSGLGNSHSHVPPRRSRPEHLLVFGRAWSWLPPEGVSSIEAGRGLVSGCGAWPLRAPASAQGLQRASAHGSWRTGFIAPRHAESSQSRDQTPALCPGRWILNGWTRGALHRAPYGHRGLGS